MGNVGQIEVTGASTQIGRVRFNDETTCIYIAVNPVYEYEVDLERCRTAGACLDWIHQIGEKNWGRAVMADFTAMLLIHVDGSLWAGK